MLSLESLLLCLTMSLCFFHVDLVLVFVAVLRLIEVDLDGNEVGLHTVDHVFVLPLHHQLVLVGPVDAFEDLPRAI